MINKRKCKVILIPEREWSGEQRREAERYRRCDDRFCRDQLAARTIQLQRSCLIEQSKNQIDCFAPTRTTFGALLTSFRAPGCFRLFWAGCLVQIVWIDNFVISLTSLLHCSQLPSFFKGNILF